MSARDYNKLADEIVAKSKELGADLVGFANVEVLKQSPSHQISEKMPIDDNVAAKKVDDRKQGWVDWPEGAKTAIVVGVSHPEDTLELDWWILGGKSKAGNTPGNRVLMSITKQLAKWINAETSDTCIELPYHIEHGGIYMKDTAVHAGLGCVGKNNLFVTPEYGPRQRFRVVLVDVDLPSPGPMDFDPCKDCPAPCRSACPVNAFDETIYTESEYGLSELPGRTGVYSRPLCSGIMDEAVNNCEEVVIEGQETPGQLAKFCRECEFACPIGKL